MANEMEASELRIGNLIYIPKTDQDATICSVTEFIGVKVNKNVIFEPIPFNDIKPIPLNKELVLKLGFEKWQDRYCLEAWSPGHPSQRFDIDWKDGNIMMKSRYQGEDDNLLMRHIKNVHQLQNLYFALTGKELEMK